MGGLDPPGDAVRARDVDARSGKEDLNNTRSIERSEQTNSIWSAATLGMEGGEATAWPALMGLGGGFGVSRPGQFYHQRRGGVGVPDACKLARCVPQ